jgi:hypothetical protein
MANKFLILLSLISAIIFSVLSCSSSKTDFEVIADYFEKKHNIEIEKNIKRIVVITDRECPSCNRALANFSISDMVDDSTLFLITSDGSRLDISSFQKLDGNVYFDWDIDPVEYNIFTASKVIFIENNNVDTIVTITSKELRQQLDFISHYSK